MTTILNYTNCEQIFESANTLVYRGIRKPDNHPVILKMLKENYPSPEKLTHYRQEYDITRDLDIDGVINTYGLEKYQNTLVMILEDIGGESLERLFKSPLEISEFLPLAIQITDILGQIHAANVIHKDINPSNLVYNPETKQLKIIDFGISTVLPRENPTLKNPNQLEGTLAYISPEQTGRMNRALDYRTDFYSLGMTFYQLLTQRLPFENQDAMELVHCHLAKPPTPPHHSNPDIPPVISNIIMKLLAKTAEERYQSAWGIKADLQECKVNLHEFTLGQQDFSDKLQPPQKLYGREQEIETLLTAFNRANQGQSEMMLVAGYSGIGKTSLVQEIYKPITQKRGYFISGKFEQFQRNKPYFAFVNAFADLMRQLLTESETQLTEWQAKILKAVGPNAQVLIEIIPELELIVGKQPDMPELPPTESQNRFNLVLQNFIKVFTQPQHPLVIFLDDLQWVDSASLKLMQLLMEATDIHALFLIGAYRDNEVTPAHPLQLTLKDIQQAKAVVNSISLPPLELPQVTQLIADALHCDLQRAYPLAELVRKKTDGNPFFMNAFLKSLYDEKLLTFDFKQGNWQWDLEKIQVRGFTNNVVELMVAQIQQLSANTQQALKLAACIGNQFDLTTLATVLDKNPKETEADLKEAIDSLLLETKKRLLTKNDLETENYSLITDCQFAHDRIQQAAYSLIPETQKPVVHRQIGQLLLQNTPLEEREQKIFAIVDQLNVGIALIKQQSERDELAQLNLIAGRKAKASAAYHPAYDYLSVGLKLLGEESWQTQYKLTLALYEESAEAAYLSGNFEQMEKWVEVLLQQAETVLDKVKAYEVKMQAYQAQKDMKKALQIGLQVLELLGVKFPKPPKKWHGLLGLLKTKVALVGKRIRDLVNLPEMTDSRHKASMRILASAMVYAYLTGSYELYALMIFKMVNLSLKQGNVPESAVGYSGYAAILCGHLGKIEAGYQFSELALDLLARLNVKEYESKTKFLVYVLAKHWQEPLQKLVSPLQEIYASGWSIGDWEFAGYAFMHIDILSYFCGYKPLSKIEQHMCLCSDTISQSKQGRALDNLKIIHQTVLNLMIRSANPSQLIGKIYDEQSMFSQHEKAKDKTAIFVLYFNKLILGYLFDAYPKAFEYSIQAEKLLEAITSFPHVPIFHFYDSLVRLALYDTATKPEQRQYRKKVRANQKKMKNWAHHASMNYQHKLVLVEAEWHHHVLGENWKAMELYDKAIAGANKNEYLNEEALAYELTAKFHLAKGREDCAAGYFRKAHYAYTRWGALAKVKHLEDNYPKIFENREPAQNSITHSGTTGIQTTTVLDLNSVLKASQAIASEMNERRLLETLMKVVIENAGAQRGVLILDKEGQWFIEAEGKIDEIDEITVLQSIPLSQLSVTSYQLSVPKAIIKYVVLTKKNVVLADATQEGQFTREPYIVAHQVKSVLCVPLLKQDKVKGLLYLENNQATSVFTQEREKMLKLLSSQIVISIENARHHTEMTNQKIADNQKISKLEQRIKALEQ